MAVASPPYHNQNVQANITGNLNLSSGSTLTMNMPPKPVELVPELVFKTLKTFGWESQFHRHRCWFTHPDFSGFYSWSEALVLETSRAFLELHK